MKSKGDDSSDKRRVDRRRGKVQNDGEAVRRRNNKWRTVNQVFQRVPTAFSRRGKSAQIEGMKRRTEKRRDFAGYACCGFPSESQLRTG
ncbi:unnamed protein product, partial [Nesidiocoris tenuis]